MNKILILCLLLTLFFYYMNKKREGWGFKKKSFKKMGKSIKKSAKVVSKGVKKTWKSTSKFFKKSFKAIKTLQQCRKPKHKPGVLYSENCRKNPCANSAYRDRCNRDNRNKEDIEKKLIPHLISLSKEYKQLYDAKNNYYGNDYYNSYSRDIDKLINNVRDYNYKQQKLNKLISDTSTLQEDQRDLIKIHKSFLPDYIENKVHYGINSHDADVLGISDVVDSST